MYKSNATFNPSLCKDSCGSSSIMIIKSPAIPPRSPALPFPDMLNCIPSLTPAGISIEIVSSPYTLPSPLHDPHFEVTVLPSPLHVGQVFTVCICPKKVLVTFFTCPEPLQVPQVCILSLSFAPLPPQVEQSTCFFTFTCLLTPFAISSKFIFNLIRKLLPL